MTRTIGIAVLSVGMFFAPGVVPAQPQSPATRPPTPESLGTEWWLRGVILAESGRFAVLQHGPTSRQELVQVGDILGEGASVVSIAPDSVVLGSEGRTVTLHLAHGADVAAPRPPVRVVPPTVLNRRVR